MSYLCINVVTIACLFFVPCYLVLTFHLVYVNACSCLGTLALLSLLTTEMEADTIVLGS